MKMQLTTYIGDGHYTSPEIEARRARKAEEWERYQQRLATEAAQRPVAKTIEQLKALHQSPAAAVAETGCIGDMSRHGK
jgi:hypothetical protein